MTPWFFQSKVGIAITRREIPIDTYELNNLVDESQPINIWQSLMQTPPNGVVKTPSNEPNIIKEALLDCMEMLTDQDQFIINAIIYEQAGYPELAKRLRSINTSRLEAYSNIISKFKTTSFDALNIEGLHK